MSTDTHTRALDRSLFTRSNLQAAAVSFPAQVLYLAAMVRAFLYVVVWLSTKAIIPEWTADSTFIGSWTRWDAGHYLSIAEHGYRNSVDHTAAFFPLYPMLMKAVSVVTPLSIPLAGMVISLGCFLVSIPLFAMLAQEILGEERARTATILFAISPFSLFYSSVYTESLFLLLCIAALWLGRREQWVLAALVVSLATATRITGLALIPPLVWLVWKRTRSIRHLAIVAVVSPLGIGSYATYNWYVFSDPLRFLTVQQEWGGHWERWGKFTDVFLNRPADVFSGEHTLVLALLNLIMLIVSIALLPIVVRKLPGEITIFTVLVMLQAAISLQSLGRYLLPALGIYLAMAILLEGGPLRQTLRSAVILMSTMLLTVLAILHTQEKWVS